MRWFLAENGSKNALPFRFFLSSNNELSEIVPLFGQKWNEKAPSFQWNVPAVPPGTIWNDFAQHSVIIAEKAERQNHDFGTGHSSFRSPRFLEAGARWKTGTQHQTGA